MFQVDELIIAMENVYTIGDNTILWDKTYPNALNTFIYYFWFLINSMENITIKLSDV